jgi:hypothetical protein
MLGDPDEQPTQSLLLCCRGDVANNGKICGLTPEEAVIVAQEFWDALLARSFRTGAGPGEKKCHVEHNWYLKAFVMEVRAAGSAHILLTGVDVGAACGCKCTHGHCSVSCLLSR